MLIEVCLSEGRSVFLHGEILVLRKVDVELRHTLTSFLSTQLRRKYGLDAPLATTTDSASSTAKKQRVE